MEYLSIAIDGPAASGKSTAAKILARRLNFLYIDTGAMYRAVTWQALQQGINFVNEHEIVRVAESVNIEIKQDWSTNRGYRILIDGKDITDNLFLPDVDKYVSIVAKSPKVRRILVKAQRKIAGDANIVMAGRDIGSNVLRHARLKIFLVASPEIRAARRQKEMEVSGWKKDFSEILENIKLRDKLDSEREDNPLIKTPDAIEVDCSNLSIEEMVNVIEKEVIKLL